MLGFDSEQSQHLKETGRFLVAFAAMPFVIGCIAAWNNAAGLVLFLVGVPLLGFVLLAGALVWTARGVKLAFETGDGWQRASTALAAPVMVGITLLLALPSLWVGGQAGTWSRFLANRALYDQIVRNAELGRRYPQADSAYERYRGVEFLIDNGPPVRVAFNPAGLLDNWSGIIFDPTGDVMKADGFDRNGKFAAPDSVTKLFWRGPGRLPQASVGLLFLLFHVGPTGQARRRRLLKPLFSCYRVASNLGGG